MDGTVEERVARMEAKQDAHEDRDDDRFDRFVNDVADIKAMVRESNDFLQKGFERVHGRIDDEASKARHSLGNEIGKVQGLVTQVKLEAAAANAVVAKSVQDLERGGRGYIEKGLWAALGMAGASIAYLIVYGPPWAKAAQAVGGP